MPADPRETEVLSEQLPHDNRKFGIRFYGRDHGAVRSRADDAVHRIDSYASPHVSNTSLHNGLWNIEVSWYSLD